MVCPSTGGANTLECGPHNTPCSSHCGCGQPPQWVWLVKSVAVWN